MTQTSNQNTILNGIDALNNFIGQYAQSAVLKPRSWDDQLLFRKYQSSDSLELEDRQLNAVRKFLKNIKRLDSSLVEFQNVVDFDINGNHFPQVELLKKARQTCHDLFRPWSKNDIHTQVNRRVEFPTGAGYVTKRAQSRCEKYHNGISVTLTAMSYAFRHLRTDIFASNSFRDSRPNAADRNIRLVDGNRFITVPKNTETERLICIEPEGNAYYQKGIGSFLKHVLDSRVGLDLTSQSKNRTMCADFTFSTIDLASASDSVSLAIVKYLLPSRVFNLLYAFRCPQSTLFGQTIKHNQDHSVFSTMGNGYTFELESLVFYCLAAAVTSSHNESVSDICVFGDDLIVKNDVAPDLVELLNFTGFEVNKDKSFTGDDLYRESCGYFYEKTDIGVHLVSPLAIKGAFNKSLLATQIFGSWSCIPLDPELIRVHNEMLRYLANTNMSLRNDKLARFYSACIKKIRALFPSQLTGRGYYEETQYLLSDTLNVPTHELGWNIRRGKIGKWSNRLLGKGLYGPPSYDEQEFEKLSTIKRKLADQHRSCMPFGYASVCDGEFSSHAFLAFHRSSTKVNF